MSDGRPSNDGRRPPTAVGASNDGRFLRSVIAEAKSSGKEPPPKLLARRSSSIAKDPTTSQLEDGPDGGGGVRLFPPHLEDVLNE